MYDFQCWVCFDLYTEPITLFCSHSFCKQCLLKSSQVELKCPFCRQEFALPLPPINIPLQNKILKLKGIEVPDDVPMVDNNNNNNVPTKQPEPVVDHMVIDDYKMDARPADFQYLLNLPMIVYMDIFHYFNAKEICSLGNVCKDFNRISNDSWLWKYKLYQYSSFCDPERYNNNYKQCYKSYFTASKAMAKGVPGTFKMTALRGHTGRITCFDHMNNTLVSGSADNTAKVWDLKEGKAVLTLTGHTDPITCIQMNSFNVATGSRDATVLLWDLETGKASTTLVRPGASEPVNALCFNPANHDQLVNSIGYSVNLFDCSTAKLTNTINAHGLPGRVSFDPLGNLVTSTSENLFVWDMRKLSSPLYRLPPTALYHATTEQYVSVRGTQVRRHSTATGALLEEFVLPPNIAPTTGIFPGPPGMPAPPPITILPHPLPMPTVPPMQTATSPVRCLTATNSEIVFAIGNNVYSYKDGQYKTFANHTGLVNCLHVDDKKIISGSLDNTIKVWDKTSGNRLYSLLGGSNVVRNGEEPPTGCIDLRSDQGRVIGSFDNLLRVYNFKM
ncbi:hypothetical protein SAMD00019534_050260 [Acytostelium subglobosum LB1]|uniref:hypothetical protein n=1 Tax=Acytostelium subglobosum LB1 TaxID=1410327 RepID=UPI0006450AAF|nr:hypothetical protein SAMD00019534_050260 [Acytostelium subglobosum LB1]GAM21851.1 hypothetical protein SAMD00019534_050260 [Acytostelium subglobosum LB1]|eukprot:XP_012754951.1 hypothetical protein SAMD00019534_050260 [Acytostelium subglobosum LB1]